jgi:hypothetical protein
MTPSNIKINATDKIFTVEGTTYCWFGGFGAVFKSREHDLEVGYVRCIGSVMFRVAYVHSRGWFRRPDVCWIPCDPFSLKDVEEIRIAIFGCKES